MLENQTIRRSIVFLGAISISLVSGCKNSDRPGGAEFHEGDALTSYSQEIVSPTSEFKVAAGATYPVSITIKNTGTQPWYCLRKVPSVDVSYRWVDAKGRELPIEGNRAIPSRPVIAPGETDKLILPVLAPPTKGSYDLWISMVQEGVVWFYLKGAKPLVLHVTVQ